tara:strand:+ start:376 stop:939 length:564 start_codon:yes stop_codon:yes gene_type:complete
MNNQNLIIFNFQILYDTLLEVENDLNFKIIKLNIENLKNFEEKNYNNFIFVTKKKVLGVNNQFIFNEFPLRLNKLVEKLNIQFLKLNYKDQSDYKIGNYSLNLNSKIFFNNSISLKLTEREIATILYLSKAKKPISIKELQLKVWDHKSILETHTVETHIHRLRKKIKEKFNDQNFILSLKEGYLIN